MHLMVQVVRLTTLKTNAEVHRQRSTGAIYAIISYFACRAPFTKFLIFGIIPIPAWSFVPGVLVYDIYEMIATKRVRGLVSLVL
jgi:hypothetical protein